MNIDEILEMSADQLEKMSDADIIAHFTPFFNITRPELAEKPRTSSGARKAEPVIDAQMRLNMQRLAAMGIDVSGALKGKKKK